MRSKLILSIVFMTFAALSGCATKSAFVESGGTSFYSNTPNGISSIWDDGRDTYLLPSRKKGIDAVTGSSGQQLDITATGAYFKVTGVHSFLTIWINGVPITASKN